MMFVLILAHNLLVAQSDFNYSFFPPEKYWSISKGDTASQNVETLIIKQQDDFKIWAIDTTLNFEAKVHFTGYVLGADMLSYATDKGVYIYCNPMWGYVLLIYPDDSAKVFGREIVDFTFIQAFHRSSQEKAIQKGKNE